MPGYLNFNVSSFVISAVVTEMFRRVESLKGLNVKYFSSYTPADNPLNINLPEKVSANAESESSSVETHMIDPNHKH